MADPSEAVEIADPCADFGPAQRTAVVWFIVMVLGGALLTARLAGIDAWMFVNNAEVLDYEKYRENRAAFSGLASERSDPRSRGDLSSAEQSVSGVE